MQAFRSLLFSISMIVSTIIITSLAIFIIFLPFHIRYQFIRHYATYNVWILNILCGVRYEIKGLENIPTGAFIIFSNHQSTWETFALQLFFPPLSFVVKKELLYVPFFGWALSMLKPVAVKRGTGRFALKQLIEKGTQRLKENIAIIIFPEGTRILPETKVEYKRGGGILAEKSGYPIVPVAHNAGYYWPKRGFVKKRGLITIHIGKPIISKGRKAKDISNEAEAFIRSHIEPAHFE